MKLIEKKRFDITRPRNIYLGLLLITVGVVWLLINFDYISEPVLNIITSWSMLLILIGGYLLALRRWFLGAVIFLHGVMFSIAEAMNVHIPYGKIIAPATIVLLGIALLVRRK